MLSGHVLQKQVPDRTRGLDNALRAQSCQRVPARKSTASARFSAKRDRKTAMSETWGRTGAAKDDLCPGMDIVRGDHDEGALSCHNSRAVSRNRRAGGWHEKGLQERGQGTQGSMRCTGVQGAESSARTAGGSFLLEKKGPMSQLTGPCCLIMEPLSRIELETSSLPRTRSAD